MKKLGIFVMSLAVVAFALTSCGGNNNNPGYDDIVENGFYIIGDAVGMPNLEAQGQFANGHNEADGNNLREGMYEKYIVLAGGQDFSFVEKAGKEMIYYTASLAKQELVSDGQNPEGYYGELKDGSATMKVEEGGFYHIVLDLNKDKKLDAAGGAQVVITPVSWGVSGDLNGWGMTVGEKEADALVWNWSNIAITANSSFKFKDEHGWKIFLDGETQQVSANTNLGANMVPGGDNIAVAEGGLYNIKLTWELAKGAIEDGYKYEMVKVGDLVLDPATFVVGISGSMQGWTDPTGVFAAKCTQADVTDAATKAGTYVYKMESVTFPAGSEFKFRFNGQWLGGGAVEIEGAEFSFAAEGGNFTAAEEGTYNIVITAVWDGEKTTSLKAVFSEGTPLDLVDIEISAIVPEGWEHCYLWAWDTSGNIFAEWPGQELQITNGHVAYSFTQVAAPLNVIFSNGDGAQTNDLNDVKDGDEIDIQANLKQ